MSINIGLVTGNNSFFLLANDDREEAGLTEREVRRIIPRFHFAAGLEFTHSDHGTMLQKNGKGFLVSVENANDASGAMREYLSRYSISDIEACSTFKKRPVWCDIDDRSPPDAFFPVMQHHGPRLVLNESGVNCTNSVHRAYFHNPFSKTTKRLLSLSLLSTFSQISAEICGRTYGSGALKHEPREAEKISVLMPNLHQRTVASAFHRVDRFLRAGNLVEARQFVDHLFLGALDIGDAHTNAALLQSGLKQLKLHRHR